MMRSISARSSFDDSRASALENTVTSVSETFGQMASFKVSWISCSFMPETSMPATDTLPYALPQLEAVSHMPTTMNSTITAVTIVAALLEMMKRPSRDNAEPIVESTERATSAACPFDELACLVSRTGA